MTFYRILIFTEMEKLENTSKMHSFKMYKNKKTTIYLKNVWSSEFFRNVVTLMTGTGLSQVITIGITVILTRMYTPEHFGLFALFISVFSIVGNPATGKYDKAILLPKEEKDSIHLTIISIGLSVIYALVILVVFILFRHQLALKLGDPELSNWLLLIPLFIISNSVANSLLVWLNKHKKYAPIAKGRVFKSSITAVVNIVFALIVATGGGLILGEIFGIMSMAIYFCFISFKNGFLNNLIISRDNIKRLLKKYKDFPKYNIPSNLINIISAQLPVILLISFFGAATVGFYSLTKRVLDAPMNLMSSAIMEVFRQKAAEDFLNKGNCTDVLLSTVKKLAIISIVPFAIFFFFAPSIFELVFGTEWRFAGEIARVLSFMYAAQFICIPITYVYNIADKQKENFILHIYMLVSTFLSLYLGYFFSFNIINTFLLFSINYCTIYMVYGYRSYLHSKGELLS